LQRFLYLIWKLVFTIICQWAQHTSWHFHVVDVKLYPSLQLLHDIESIMPLKTAISSYPWPTIDIQRETLLIACSCFFIVLSKVHWIQSVFGTGFTKINVRNKAVSVHYMNLSFSECWYQQQRYQQQNNRGQYQKCGISNDLQMLPNQWIWSISN
jgi:hypothetical protein